MLRTASFSSGAPSDSCMPNSRGRQRSACRHKLLYELSDHIQGGDRTVEHRRVHAHRRPPPLTAPPSHPLRPVHVAGPRHGLQARPKANPGTRADTHDRVRADRVDEEFVKVNESSGCYAAVVSVSWVVSSAGRLIQTVSGRSRIFGALVVPKRYGCRVRASVSTACRSAALSLANP
jgi:hypothetical protein